MTFLVDTNVVSELARKAPNPGVRAWAATQNRILMSAISIEEVLFGLQWKPNPRNAAWWHSLFSDWVDVLEVTTDIAERAGAMRGRLRAEGRVRQQGDMIIAATAAQHGLTLVTRNTRDFEGCAIPLLDPFAP
jgi:toxin FitB